MSGLPPSRSRSPGCTERQASLSRHPGRGSVVPEAHGNLTAMSTAPGGRQNVPRPPTVAIGRFTITTLPALQQPRSAGPPGPTRCSQPSPPRQDPNRSHDHFCRSQRVSGMGAPGIATNDHHRATSNVELFFTEQPTWPLRRLSRPFAKSGPAVSEASAF